MNISRHAMQRSVERSGISKKATKRLFDEKVLIKGVPAEKTVGKVRRWTQTVYDNSPIGLDEIYLYGERAYLIKNENLITVLIIPADCAKEFHRMKQKVAA